MINTNKVKGRIAEQGKTIQKIATKMPCTAYSLGQKIANKTPMNLEEAILLAIELEISKEEFTGFFLNDKLQNTTKMEG